MFSWACCQEEQQDEELVVVEQVPSASIADFALNEQSEVPGPKLAAAVPVPVKAESEARDTCDAEKVGGEQSAAQPLKAPSAPPCAPGSKFRIVVERAAAGQALGLDTMARNLPSPALKITKVHPGLMQAWNEANPGTMVKEGDLILSVNNVRSDMESMYDEILNKMTLAMLIYRA